MNLKNRWVWFGIIALVGLVLLSFLAAPRTPSLQRGSTYSRAPDGYGAWFAYLEQQGAPIQRWKRPLESFFDPTLLDRSPDATEIVDQQSKTSTLSQERWTSTHPESGNLRTLIRISNGLSRLGIDNADWIAQGNVLVLVGVRAPVTKAPYRSSLNHPVGRILIETSRRFSPDRSNADLPSPAPELNLAPDHSSDLQKPFRSLLQDSYGSVVALGQVGKGQVIWIATPHLAANAYQDEPGNFKFLADLVTQPGYPIWVDEYLHGYKDQAVIQKETSGSLMGYLLRTPLLIVLLQATVLLLILIWGHNQRLGAPLALTEPQEDNSAAYIQALATVLQKAHASDFVVETISKAEQLQVQRSLGLGTDLLEPEAIFQAWQQQTGRPVGELADLFNWRGRSSQRLEGSRPSDQELLIWLRNIQRIRHHLNS